MSQIQKLLLAAGVCLMAFICGLCLGDVTYSIKQSQIKQPDSLEYAVYASRPVDYPEDCEPVYIPMDMLGIHEPGDFVWVDTSTNILAELPLRNAESHQVASIYERVLLEERLEYNRKFPLKR